MGEMAEGAQGQVAYLKTRHSARGGTASKNESGLALLFLVITARLDVTYFTERMRSFVSH